MDSETEAYFAALHTRRHEARRMQHRTVATDDWTPKRAYCHDNVNYLVGTNPQLRAVRGWLIISEEADGRCNFAAHSVIEDAGELYDITLSNQSECDPQQKLLCELEQLSYYHDTFLGRLIKRKYAQFGYKYGSTGRTLEPVAPFPPFLQQLADKARSACHEPEPINQSIITCYEAGSGIGWHTDAATFEDSILGVSLGAPARLQFRAEKTAPVEFELAVHSGSLYCMSGRARWDYQHRVPPVNATRYSLTFRTVLRYRSNYSRGNYTPEVMPNDR